MPSATFSSCHVRLINNPDSNASATNWDLEQISAKHDRLRIPDAKPSFDISPPANSSPDSFSNPIQEESLPQETSYSRTAGAYRLMENIKKTNAESKKDKWHGIRASIDLASQIGRQWKAGDAYAPHDLHQAELSRYKFRNSPQADIFDHLDMNPLEHYRNLSLMSEWMTPMGRIKTRKETGLRPVNQRRIAKAIRRSIGIGIMPSVYRHPEILYKERKRLENEVNAY